MIPMALLKIPIHLEYVELVCLHALLCPLLWGWLLLYLEKALRAPGLILLGAAASGRDGSGRRRGFRRCLHFHFVFNPPIKSIIFLWIPWVGLFGDWKLSWHLDPRGDLEFVGRWFPCFVETGDPDSWEGASVYRWLILIGQNSTSLFRTKPSLSYTNVVRIPTHLIT